MTARDTRGLGSDRRPRSDWPYQKGRDPLGRIPTPPHDDPIEIMRGDWALGRLDRHRLDDLLDIRGGIGRGEVNDREDIARLETLLAHTGHRDLKSTSGPTGLFGSPQENAIRGFQKDQGLREDGILRPGGETLTTLAKTLAAKRRAAQTRRAAAPDPAADLGFPALGTATKPPQDAQPQAPTDPPVTVGGKEGGNHQQATRSRPGWKRRPDPIQVAKTHMVKNLKAMRHLGYSRAEKHLKHYLEGSGKDIIYSREEMREVPQFREAEKINKSRFEKSFTGEQKQTPGEGKKKYVEKIKNMKDGGKEKLEIDEWDSKYTDISQILLGDTEFALAFGDTHLNSKGSFEAKRKGNLVYIYGTVTHRLDDPYDFEKHQPGGYDALVLEDSGLATRFKMKAEWKQNVAGTVSIEDDKYGNSRVTNPRFDWTDVDPE